MSPFLAESATEVLSSLGSWINRRAHPRLRERGTVSIRLSPNGPASLGVLLDLSRSGCGIELGSEFAAPVDANVEVEMFFGGVQLRRLGIIRYVKTASPTGRENRFGVGFVEDGSESARQYHLHTKRFLAQSNGLGQDGAYEPILRKLWTHLTRLRE